MANWWEEFPEDKVEPEVQPKTETAWYEQYGAEPAVVAPTQAPVEAPTDSSGAIIGGSVGAGAGFAATRRIGAPKTTEQGYKAALAKEARREGYVVPPRLDPSSSRTARIAEVVSGPEKLYQDVVHKNTEKALSTIRQDLNLPEDTPLTRETLLKIREEAGKPYEEVSQLRWKIKTPQVYRDRLDSIGRSIDTKLTEMPELFKKAPEIQSLLKTIDVPTMSMEAAVSAVKTLRNKAESNLNSPDVEAKELGKAQKQAADTIDELIGKTLESHGKGRLYKRYEQSSKTIDKTYDIASAINETTGELDFAKLGRDLKDKEQLTGGLKDVVTFSRAFPQAVTSRKIDPSRMTVSKLFDMLPMPVTAGGLMFAQSNPLLGGTMIAAGGVPASRAATRGILSGPIYQKGLSKLPGPAKFFGPVLGVVGGGVAGALSQMEENQP